MTLRFRWPIADEPRLRLYFRGGNYLRYASGRLRIGGTLSALASFNKKLSQTDKSEIGTHQSAILQGGVR